MSIRLGPSQTLKFLPPCGVSCYPPMRKSLRPGRTFLNDGWCCRSPGPLLSFVLPLDTSNSIVTYSNYYTLWKHSSLSSAKGRPYSCKGESVGCTSSPYSHYPTFSENGAKESKKTRFSGMHISPISNY